MPGLARSEDVGDPMAETRVDGASDLSRSATVEAPALDVEIADGLGRLDRYVLIERVGQGAFASVWAAYDPKLDRRVAIKVLLWPSEVDEASAGRLAASLAEAQALAQLAHPNVVAVHDVQTLDESLHERGVAGLFIVMEFLAGSSLRSWIDAEPRPPWRRVLEVFVAAGRGLAAAHERGLIHRDFKPSNVMFGADGRPRVLDFGLAQTRARSRGVGDEPQHYSHRIHRIVGTPAYMAPEQHLGAEIDARADQFSFCVAFYEALYGERPFAGHDRRSLGAAKIAGELRDEPRHAHVPAWIHGVLVRGLAPSADERYPSMDALLADLERDPALHRRRILVGMALVAVFAGSGLGLAQTDRQRDSLVDSCEAPAERFTGIWDDPVRARIEAAFHETEATFADDAFARVESELDHHMRQWSTQYTEACAATLVRDELPVAVMAERMLCLDRDLRRIAGLTAALQQTDASTVARATDTVRRRLAQPLDCITRRADHRRERIDDDRREALLEAEATVARAESQLELGRYDDALDSSAEARARARALDDAGSLGRAELAAAGACWHLGDYQEAEAAAERAIAAAARVDDQITIVMAQLRLLRTYTAQDRFDSAQAIAVVTRALVRDARLGADVEAWYDFYVGILATKRGDLEQAQRHLEHGLALRQQLYGDDHPALADFHNTLGNVMQRRGDDRAAAADRHYREALRLWIDNYGDQYPSVAIVRNNLGGLYLRRGELERARESFAAALASQEQLLGPSHPSNLAVLVNLGVVAREAGRNQDALAFYERALGIARDQEDPQPQQIAKVASRLANTLISLGQPERAEPLLREVLAVRSNQAGPHAGETALAHEDLMRCLLELGRGDEAREHRDAAIAIYDQLAADPRLHARAQSLQAQAALEQRDFAGARALAEAALQPILDAYEVDELDDPIRVRHEWILIQALAQTGELEPAARRARGLLTAAPDNRGLWQIQLALAEIEAALGHVALARAAFDHAAALCSGPDGNPLHAAQVADRRGLF